MDNNTPVISAKNLNLWYGDFKALKSISLDVGEKEITALIGPSGCGKSTFLKTLNRMNDLVPNVRIEGDVRLRGEDIFSKEMQLTDLRRRVGMVFQKANPFPMSIYDNITYGPKLHGVHNKAELDELVESSLRGAALWDEVKDRLRKSALGLSGGQQQRLCIARALAVKPEGLRPAKPSGPRGRRCTVCVCSYRKPSFLTEAARDVVLGALVLRGAEDLTRGAALHQLAQQEEGRAVADTGCLLHIVGDDDHGVVLDAVEDALESLCTADAEGAKEIIKGDSEVNRMERDIEHRCMTVVGGKAHRG